MTGRGPWEQGGCLASAANVCVFMSSDVDDPVRDPAFRH